MRRIGLGTSILIGAIAMQVTTPASAETDELIRSCTFILGATDSFMEDMIPEEDYSRAVRGCSKFIESGQLTGSDLISAYEGRAHAESQLDDLDGTIADYGKLIELKPRDAYNYSIRADALLKQGQPADAITDLSKCIELELKYVEMCYSTRASVYLKLNKAPIALVDINKAIELAPTSSSNFHQRGLIYEALGERDRAIADFHSAIKKAGSEGDEESDAALKRLNAQP